MAGHDGHRGWVYYLAVDPAHRGRGLGRELMEEAGHWLASRGAQNSNSWSGTAMTPPQNSTWSSAINARKYPYTANGCDICPGPADRTATGPLSKKSRSRA